jgi:hypothetical protein
MKRLLGLVLIALFCASTWALNPIKVGGGEVTPFLDAEQEFQYRWGGIVDYNPGFVNPPQAEAGLRYEKAVNDDKVYSTVSIANPYLDDKFEIGQMNVGYLLNGKHNFVAGKGTYPFGITMRNNHFNNRIDVWAPTTLSVFSYNIIGEYKEAFIYEYIQPGYKLKFGAIQDTPYFTEDSIFVKRTILNPVSSIEMSLTNNLEAEFTYSQYKGYMKTYIVGIGYEFPKDIRLEVEYVNHKRFGSAFSLLESPDSDIAIKGVPNVFGYYLDNIEYQSVSFLLKKKFFPAKKNPFTIYAEHCQLDSTADAILETSMFSMTVKMDGDWSQNASTRVGINYELSENVSWATEYEHNTIDVLPHWAHRVSSALRLRF